MESDLQYESKTGVNVSVENGRLKITGNVKASGKSKIKTFTGYFVPGSGTALHGYQFDQLIVQ